MFGDALLVNLLTTFDNTLQDAFASHGADVPWDWRRSVLLDGFVHRFRYGAYAVEDISALCSLEIQAMLEVV